jgi:L-methionine (R)-S-oxide reductase
MAAIWAISYQANSRLRALEGFDRLPQAAASLRNRADRLVEPATWSGKMATDLIERSPTGTDVSDERSRYCGTADGLTELARILDSPDHPEAHWSQSASLIAALLNARSCWILFPGTDENGDMTVRAYGDEGVLPAGAHQDLVREGSRFRQVLATARCLLIERTDGILARAPISGDQDEAGQNMILAPIQLDDTIVGVVSVHAERHESQFNEKHIDTIRIAALLIAKSLDLVRLRKVLNSRFAQLALMQGTAVPGDHVVREAIKCPGGMAGLLAKSFYREMSRAGFDPHEIIAAASEIISQLVSSLKARDKRAGRRRAADRPSGSESQICT